MADTGDSASAYDGAFETIVRTQCQALLVMASPDFARDRKLIIERAARARVPAIYGAVAAMHAKAASCRTERRRWTSTARSPRQIDKILRGAKPGDVPVEQPSRYEMAINLATAKSLGLVIPQALLLQADHIID